MSYYELDPSQNEFKTLSIQTTYQCQQTCANCYLGDMLNNDSIPDVDLVRFEAAIKRLPKRTDIRFIGAEPTMNDNLTKMIKIVRQSGHRPSLLTNGLKLRRDVYVKELKQAGLNLLGLSMNGGTSNELYQLFDNGKYAKSKMIALDNCFKYKMLPHINMIVDPSNVDEIKNLIGYIEEIALKNNIKFSPTKFPVMLRLKSIGKMGIYRDTYTYNIRELQDIVKGLHGDDVTFFDTIDGHLEKRSLTYKFNTCAGVMLGKITDWSVDDDGCPDSGSTRRGILTDDYKVAPFFEYYIKKQGEL